MILANNFNDFLAQAVSNSGRSDLLEWFIQRKYRIPSLTHPSTFVLSFTLSLLVSSFVSLLSLSLLNSLILQPPLFLPS